MEKKFLGIILLTTLIIFSLFSYVLAVPPVMITNPDGSGIVETTNNAIRISDKAKKLTTQLGSGQMYTGTCRILSINVFGQTAGDNAAIYDDIAGSLTILSTDTYLEWELGITANKTSAFVDAKGAPFERGIYIKASAETVLTTITYDY